MAKAKTETKSAGAKAPAAPPVPSAGTPGALKLVAAREQREKDLAALKPPTVRPGRADDSPPSYEPITMIFPSPMRININPNLPHLVFGEGANEVPASVIRDYGWYLENHGVKPYKRKV